MRSSEDDTISEALASMRGDVWGVVTVEVAGLVSVRCGPVPRGTVPEDWARDEGGNLVFSGSEEDAVSAAESIKAVLQS